MLTNIVTKVFGSKHDRDLKRIQPIVDQINEIYPTLEKLTDEELRQKTDVFKTKINEATSETREEIERLEAELRADVSDTEATDGSDANQDASPDHDAIRDRLAELDDEEREIISEVLDEILPEAFAVVKDACRRLVGKKWNVADTPTLWEMVPYDVQLIGGIVLHEGKIAEMATGEGKTLVATLPLYLNALTGRGAHLVTVNDYLARRDCEWMGKVYEFLGLTSAFITHDMNNDQRRDAYRADITYGTNNEFGFDYLRDNMAVRLDDKVQRRHNYAIVDEVDSVLIDEARTPLIISGPVESTSDAQYQAMKPRVEALVRAQTQLANRLVSEGEKLLEEGNEEDAGILLLRATRGFPKHKKLTKLMNEVGVKRLIKRIENDYLRDKRMHEIDEELYYAIDEKGHTIDITDKGREYLSPNDPEMFVLPDLSERTHAIELDEELTSDQKVEAREQLDQEYMKKADSLHSIQQLLRAYSLYEKDVEYVVNDGKVVIVDEFTGRLMAGRRYSDGLHQALEAKEGVKIEGETQTLATITLQNYFRMYDKLAGMTGTAETESSEFWEIYKLDVVVIPTNKPIARQDFEDSIYRTRREKYNAALDEIEDMYRQKRPVLVGTVSVEVSETLSRMLKRRGIPHSVLNAKYHQKEAEIVARAGEPGRVTIATNMAGRGTDIKLGAGVVESGGLHIIGTERHEARRIDRQLRGRSGRQGDPGSSRFYMSLEDDLMRLFGSDRIANVMDRMGLEEGEVIEHKMVTKSIERAQKRVEGHNFDIRKHLLEYDNVMNQQREVIYDRRNHALRGENLRSEIMEMLSTEVAHLVNVHANTETGGEWDMETLRFSFQKTFLSDWPLTEEDEGTMPSDEMSEKLARSAVEVYRRKESVLGKDVMRELERMVILRVIDEKWRDHLYEMDQLKDGIGLRAYGQKDPLIEYKREGFNLFEEMLDSLNRDVLKLIFRAQVQRPDASYFAPRRRPAQAQMVASHQSSTGMGFQGQPQAPSQQQAGKKQPVKLDQKVGRNDPCPCGSGKSTKSAMDRLRHSQRLYLVYRCCTHE